MVTIILHAGRIQISLWPRTRYYALSTYPAPHLTQETLMEFYLHMHSSRRYQTSKIFANYHFGKMVICEALRPFFSASTRRPKADSLLREFRLQVRR
jgi:hypothetical protein